MKNLLVLVSLLFFSQMSIGQIVINELDCDTPSIDDKEFVELKSDIPNFSLNGYVVVFFNGSASGGNTSYLAIDLMGIQQMSMDYYLLVVLLFLLFPN